MTDISMPVGLAPESRQIFKMFIELGLAEYDCASIEEMRQLAPLELPLFGAHLPVGQVADLEIDGASRPIPLRIFHPMSDVVDRIILWIHGGGWALGDLDTAEADCRRLSRANSAVVVAVEYSLAPEFPFPAGLEDVYTALQWVYEDLRPRTGGLPPIVVGGDSAGGNLAAATCVMVRDRGYPAVDHQLLVYPPTNWSFKTDSYREFADGYLLLKEGMEMRWNTYAGGEDNEELAANPLFSVLRTEDMSGLPPATVVIAGCDILRDDGELYAEKLLRAGVQVRVLRYPGQVHGFFSCGGATRLPEIVNADIAEAIGQSIAADA